VRGFGKKLVGRVKRSETRHLFSSLPLRKCHMQASGFTQSVLPDLHDVCAFQKKRLSLKIKTLATFRRNHSLADRRALLVRYEPFPVPADPEPGTTVVIFEGHSFIRPRALPAILYRNNVWRDRNQRDVRAGTRRQRISGRANDP
jgi:hypothetical protein